MKGLNENEIVHMSCTPNQGAGVSGVQRRGPCFTNQRLLLCTERTAARIELKELHYQFSVVGGQAYSPNCLPSCSVYGTS